MQCQSTWSSGISNTHSLEPAAVLTDINLMEDLVLDPVINLTLIEDLVCHTFISFTDFWVLCAASDPWGWRSLATNDRTVSERQLVIH